MDTYLGYTSGRGPSPAIWGNCPWLEIFKDPTKGYQFWDDFFTGITEDPDNAGVFERGPWKAFGDTGVTFNPLATAVGGVVRVSMDADDEEFYLTTGNNTGVLGKFQTAASEQPYKMWFETRFRTEDVTSGDRGIFLGMSEEGLAGANTFAADAASVADKDYVGFRILPGDPNGLDIVHNTATGGETVLQEASVNTTYQNVAADTWKKCGWYFDGDTTVTFYIDGVEIVSVETTATNFPDGEELALLLAQRQHGAGTVTVDYDWVRWAQLAA